MKKVSFKTLPFMPASHEDLKNPGVLKKILFTAKDIIPHGKIQMINWALLPKGKKFTSHYHEDMEEIFIILSGSPKISMDGENVLLHKGDCVVIPLKTIHMMANEGIEDVDYLVIGISLGKRGKTVIAE